MRATITLLKSINMPCMLCNDRQATCRASITDGIVTVNLVLCPACVKTPINTLFDKILPPKKVETD